MNSIGNWVDIHDGNVTGGPTNSLKFVPGPPWLRARRWRGWWEEERKPVVDSGWSNCHGANALQRLAPLSERLDYLGDLPQI